MKRIVQFSSFLLLLTVLLMFSGEGNQRILAQGDKKAKGKEIPLREIYYTLDQPGVKWLLFDENCPKEMNALNESVRQLGASNLFLARGDNSTAAIKATWEVFCKGQSVAEPVPRLASSRSDQFWLTAFLGSTGSHGAWLLKSAYIDGKTIRLNYSQEKEEMMFLDLHPHFVWVPLGKLEPGNYALELFEVNEKRVTLMRRVTIPQRK